LLILRDAIRGQRKRITRLSLEFLTVAGGQVLAVAGAMIGIRIVTEVVSPAVFSEVKLISPLILLTSLLLFSPLANYAMRGFPAAASEGLERPFVAFTRRSVGRVFVLSALPFGITLAGYLTVKGQLDAAVWTLALTVLGLTGLWELERSLLLPQRRQGRGALMRNTESRGLPLGVSAAVFLLGDSSHAYFSGWALFLLIGLGFYYAVGVPSLPQPERPPDAKRIAGWRREGLTYGAPLVAMGLISWAMANVNRYILDFHDYPVATYIACFGLASQPFLILHTMLSQFFRPIWYAAAEKQQQLRMKRLMAAYVAGAFAASAAGLGAFYLLGRAVIDLVLAEPYREGAFPLLVWIAAGYAAFVTAGGFQIALLAEKRTGLLTLAHGVGTAVTVGAGLLLIPRESDVGAAKATFFGFVAFLSLLGLYFMRRRRSAEVGTNA